LILLSTLLAGIRQKKQLKEAFMPAAIRLFNPELLFNSMPAVPPFSNDSMLK
jgi:hypothetical protein